MDSPFLVMLHNTESIVLMGGLSFSNGCGKKFVFAQGDCLNRRRTTTNYCFMEGDDQLWFSHAMWCIYDALKGNLFRMAFIYKVTMPHLGARKPSGSAAIPLALQHYSYFMPLDYAKLKTFAAASALSLPYVANSQYKRLLSQGQVLQIYG